ncbi:hemerythrin domain-containing protein [Azoarcus sp. KH32C]|uniref:hemerythrin domain-containing protein n=1 Tax=Azoarcus sp. KH32C TaxID=748247 RepID=UPI0002385D1E|nr:hemerythrin domain-containing protein [Azoarcus sp. KH32C]BAL26978.1 hypothetical protein AZKH_p0095 [Azoarcus sp. KH32C]
MSEHIARWHVEHANYYKLLDLLESLIETFIRSERPDYDLMSDIVYYMTQYPDRFHHPREDVAFRRLLARDPGIAPVIDELANQHRGISASSEALSADLRAAAEGAMMARATLQSDVRNYLALLRYHMDVEEREIFPRLAVLLDDEDWFLVDSAIHFAADPIFDDVVQERFKTLHHRIAREAGCRCKDAPEPACHLD